MASAERATATIPDLLPSRRPSARVWQLIRSWPVIPAVILTLLATFAVFAPLLANQDPEKGNLRVRIVPPVWLEGGSREHLLGTDQQGRDIWSRIVYGTRISLLIATIVLSAGAVGGTALGIMSGYYGGLVDEILMRMVDLTFAMPFILVALVVVIVLGQSMEIIIILLIVFSWGAFARQARGETLALKEREYVAGARVAGASSLYLMFRHILPGLINTIIVMSSLTVGQLILAEAVLSFLGLGIPPPTPAWGAMVADGRDYIATAWWITFFPGLMIFLTVVGFNFLGDWLRDYFDPRLRQVSE